MSVNDLQSRIEEASERIERHRAAIEELEDSKIALKGQLNSHRDPVARLPLEISSDIFIRCLPAQPRPGAHYAPMLLLNVCSAWTAIAVATPALWAAIHIVSPHAERLSKVFEYWLPRADKLPLAMSFRGCLVNIASAVKPYSERLKNLELYPEGRRGFTFARNIGPLPSLEALKICGFVDGMTTSGAIDVLRVAPNLVECTLQEFALATSKHTPKRLVLPSLRYLRFSPEDDRASCSPDDILMYLTLPALETLHLPMFGLSNRTFASFLKRCSPPLRKLFIGGRQRCEDSDFIGLNECLCLAPSLIHLEVNSPDDGFLGPFFVTLAESSAAFLPVIQSIMIHDHYWEPSNADYMALVRALFARRTQLVRFELSLDPDGLVLPGPDINAALQELRADGMYIHIESAGQTLFSST